MNYEYTLLQMNNGDWLSFIEHQFVNGACPPVRLSDTNDQKVPLSDTNDQKGENDSSEFFNFVAKVCHENE